MTEPPPPGEVDRQRMIDAYHATIAFYRSHLQASQRAVAYLRTRGFDTLVTDDQPWRVGYAPAGWAHLTDHLDRVGFTATERVAAGLVRQSASGRLYDAFRDRIMFP